LLTAFAARAASGGYGKAEFETAVELRKQLERLKPLLEPKIRHVAIDLTPGRQAGYAPIQEVIDELAKQ
jgi:hypothetical protein